MYNYKILFKITGSIAAYKSAYLISKLVQNNCEVKVAATEDSLKFIGSATLEGLTGNPVYTDSFAPNQVMSHINLDKWADLVIVCPATANTINKFANGIADNLLTSLFLAHDWAKPYLIAPAMNTLMYQHPATQASLKKLEEWGAVILPTAEGYLACGDTGKGKLLEPDEIYERIFTALASNNKDEKKLRVLVTSGATKENIDGVRFITNLSTGKTGSAIADYFRRRNNFVTTLLGEDSMLPSTDCEKIFFKDFNDLNGKLEKLLRENDFDAVIHLAAVSDYSLDSIEMGSEKFNLPVNKKISSEQSTMILKLKRNFKIVEKLKSYSHNKNTAVTAFKFTNTDDENERAAEVGKLFSKSAAEINFVVLNDKADRTNGNVQAGFRIYDRTMNFINCSTAFELAQKLEIKLRELI
ncbi:MAG: bifunctional phosphopantothenoylcysteine decarboxylase/phosphopantothenate--cysteine ligase CoaBC [Ignavibacteriales bacterium]|nr:bifunctional phosphopantothenoylcysteine decarboxylase/phosphopantothenate--cysteine ligase CoaBC [Ignavibacteriales bacterium]